MIEQVGTSSTMQIKTASSAKPAETAKAQEASEKEQTAVKSELRKRDRFELSGKTSYAAGSPDDPKAREAFDAKQSAAKAENSRSYDRLELSSEYVSDSSESVNTNELYQYTDTELKDLLLDGSITQSDYDAELAKREI